MKLMSQKLSLREDFDSNKQTLIFIYRLYYELETADTRGRLTACF